jgi:hypothetical protein
MAKLIAVEDSLFDPESKWFVFDDGRRLLRKLAPAARSGGVAIISDHIEPVQSMADGRTYDSKSALYRSYRADGNPQGIRYECVGNEDTTRFTPPARDKAKSIAAIKRALGDL